MESFDQSAFYISTILENYKRIERQDDSYQTEEMLENKFISDLQDLGYEYIKINSEDELRTNLRHQLEKLNDIKFTDVEWAQFFNENISNKNDTIVSKTRRIQEDYIQILNRDDGSFKNIYLIDKHDVERNHVQVMNQYVVGKESGARRDNRYDVTILVNGLPLVHVELKSRSVAIKEAFNQIDRYQRDSFWAGSGLFDYVQVFVISNGTKTKYYSNTTRKQVAENNSPKFEKFKNDFRKERYVKKTSNSFEFTSFWADAGNNNIHDLEDFTQTFFIKTTLLNVITKYCVFNSDDMLLVLRPYQITAAERVLRKIIQSQTLGTYGSRDGGGFIWHTTGSGKTLTSFKIAKMACSLDFIEKVIFVVDRKDLDYQTMKEYEKFEKGAANSTNTTSDLRKKLESDDSKIIVTTIQKLSKFIKANKSHPIYDKRVVIIFDECHRSQFGAMHSAVIKHFTKYNIFGFTGTPIFAANVINNFNSLPQTTEMLFGELLHEYNITNAIKDKNVLPFSLTYNSSVRIKDNVEDEKIEGIDEEKIFNSPERIAKITKYIIKNFAHKTRRNESSFYVSRVSNISDVVKAGNKKDVSTIEIRNERGFNSILAVGSIEAAKLYYNEFKKVQEEEGTNLRVALIYSYAPNQQSDIYTDNFTDEENSDNTESLQMADRDFLELAIGDYNQMFGTSYGTSADLFANYYKDVSLRMKNREIDILIVVNMFLTGFDAPTLNTLWVDKTLRMHGLIQAFSRTNRIFNSVKAHGVIVCFRGLEKQVDDAIGLFGNKDASGIVLIRSFEDYFHGYVDDKGKRHKGYKEYVDELFSKFPLDHEIAGNDEKRDFVFLFGKIMRMRNILGTFDEMEAMDPIKPRMYQDYVSIYLEIKEEIIGNKKANKENVNEDLIFEVELLKNEEVGFDEIMEEARKRSEEGSMTREFIIDVERKLGASITLRSKKELIMRFIAKMNNMKTKDFFKEWDEYKQSNFFEEISKVIDEENLDETLTIEFFTESFERGYMDTSGQKLIRLMPPMSLFTKNEEREKEIEKISKRLEHIFLKYI